MAEKVDRDKKIGQPLSFYLFFYLFEVDDNLISKLYHSDSDFCSSSPFEQCSNLVPPFPLSPTLILISFTRNQSALVAFAVGAQFKPGQGVHIVGAHTDSPNLHIKPISKKKEKEGYMQCGEF